MFEPLETVLLTVGPNDKNRLDELSETVVQVAKPADATVVITHVFTPDQFQEIAEDLGMSDLAETEVDEVLERHESVRHFEQVFDEHGVDYEVKGVVGDISDGIIGIAERTESDRVVVSGRTRSAVGKAVFGSTAQDVLLNAPCPVTYVKAKAKD
ncbi:universal stress protein [Haloplanus rallus]|jgi:nucleotide-binding universal stress UspA family protein|uniref:Universal stress protein n=1 Tax=Haloplanus rallus TaxID=1816183 RepID=A0A6B9F387_9EURY|nr:MULTISPECIES: universal stress protein [Haloplanus]QGX94866.1 universal stress protein [Haloplanus rallus]